MLCMNNMTRKINRLSIRFEGGLTIIEFKISASAIKLVQNDSKKGNVVVKQTVLDSKEDLRCDP